MKSSSNHPKLKTPPRSHLFSCAFFRHCTQSVLSPTATPSSPSLQQQLPSSSSSSSSSSNNTSQSFTQWRFPLPPPPHPPHQPSTQTHFPSPPTLHDAFHAAELHFSSASESSRVAAVQLLEHSLVPNNGGGGGESTGSICVCPITVARGVVACLRDGVARRAASKVLLAVSLMEVNRRVVVEAGAVSAVVEALADAESATAERSLAALELLCTTAEGAAEVRAHALAVPMMVQVMGRMEGRGKEHAISVLAVIYGGEGGGAAVAPAEEVARAVMLALQGECSARGRRKGAQLLKILQGDGIDEGRDGR